jgi:hypothetical protein
VGSPETQYRVPVRGVRRHLLTRLRHGVLVLLDQPLQLTVCVEADLLLGVLEAPADERQVVRLAQLREAGEGAALLIEAALGQHLAVAHGVELPGQVTVEVPGEERPLVLGDPGLHVVEVPLDHLVRILDLVASGLAEHGPRQRGPHAGQEERAEQDQVVLDRRQRPPVSQPGGEERRDDRRAVRDDAGGEVPPAAASHDQEGPERPGQRGARADEDGEQPTHDSGPVFTSPPITPAPRS